MTDRQNIVLVTIDSLRADHCSYLDPGSGLTPTLDRLASDGVAFEQAIAPGPRTPSSVPTSFTGYFGRTEQLAVSDWRRRYERISEHLRRHRTLTDRLRERGYTTVGVSANPWTQNADFDHGFDRFVGIDGDDAIEHSPVWSAIDSVFERVPTVGTYNWNQAKHWLVDWTDYYETIQDAVAGTERPYFLWVFLLDVHQPYLPPRAHREETSTVGLYYANVRERMLDAAEFPTRLTSRLHSAYRDAVRSADAFLARLQGDLAGDDPAIVVHSDHGEAFGEHGTYGHERRLYEENLHVPLVVGNVETDERVTEPVSLARLPDVLTDVADGAFQGGERYTSEFVVASTEGETDRALRGDRWKLIETADGVALYDLEADPNEGRDLADRNATVRDLLAQLSRTRRGRQLESAEIAVAIDDLVLAEGSL